MKKAYKNEIAYHGTADIMALKRPRKGDQFAIWPASNAIKTATIISAVKHKGFYRIEFIFK